MAVSLKKKDASLETTLAKNEALSSQKVVEAEPPEVRLKKKILDLSLFQSKYCDEQVFQNLLRYAIDDCGIDAIKAKARIDFELEQGEILNESRKIEELYSLLQRFTQNDKRLDAKERDDALQIVSNKKSGYAKSLNPEVANAHLIKFCRDNGIKIKTSLFKWEIP